MFPFRFNVLVALLGTAISHRRSKFISKGGLRTCLHMMVTVNRSFQRRAIYPSLEINFDIKKYHLGEPMCRYTKPE